MFIYLNGMIREVAQLPQTNLLQSLTLPQIHALRTSCENMSKSMKDLQTRKDRCANCTYLLQSDDYKIICNSIAEKAKYLSKSDVKK
jgi:hypothetical protein